MEIREATVTQSWRAYLYYTDVCNYEGVECEETETGNLILKWIARGTGTMREPTAELVGDVIVVRPRPKNPYLEPRNFCGYCLVVGGCGKELRFESATPEKGDT